MSDIGTLGEMLVAKWLQSQNYSLLQQNWRCRWGEIDLIAQELTSGAIAFVEVKTRSQFNWDENGLLAVNATKQAKIITTAEMFLAKYPNLAEFPCRFDVALVSYVIPRPLDSLDPLECKENVLDLGVPVLIDKYQLTIENYLKSAFET